MSPTQLVGLKNSLNFPKNQSNKFQKKVSRVNASMRRLKLMGVDLKLICYFPIQLQSHLDVQLPVYLLLVLGVDKF